MLCELLPTKDGDKLVYPSLPVEFGVFEALRVLTLLLIIIPASVIDIRYRIIPDRLHIAGAVLSLPLLLQSKQALVFGINGFLIGGVVLFVIAILSNGGIGGGDIKLAAVIGLYLGYGVILTIILAFAAGGIYCLVMLVLKKARLRDTMPFGPFLSLGAIVVLFMVLPLVKIL